MKATRPALVLVAVLAVGGLTACTAVTTANAPTTAAVETAASVASASLWDSSVVHDIEVTIADADLNSVLDTYTSTGEKIWVSATVVIDGVTFENVGIKLKGNSTLRVVSSDSGGSELPWLIRLDKYVDGQNLDGETELVVRGNSSETALNEAVALELLSEAGLASQEAISSRFSVNGGATQLRLVIQNPDEDWDAQEFGTTGLLYKAEAGGDYRYRGDDPASYADIFDQETGDDNLTPLITFLKFVNESDDATFVAEIGNYLDVDSFATYLAFQSLIDNFDDIDGPGNNSYLHFDETTGLMTVVNWDLNLAFGVQNVAGAGGEMPGGGQGGGRPNGAVAPGGALGGALGGAPGGAPGGAGNGGPSSGNVLAERFEQLFPDAVPAATEALTSSLISSGAAQDALDSWVAVLKAGASDLVSSATIDDEAAAIRGYLG